MKIAIVGFAIDYKNDFAYQYSLIPFTVGLPKRHFYFNGFMHLKEGYK